MNIFKELAFYLDFPFVRYAIYVGALTALCASLIGVSLVLKRYSFIGEGLSHVAFAGMALAIVVNMTNNLLLIMPLTVLISVLLLGRGSKAKIKGDAAIAMLSVGALAIGYFVINRFSSRGNVAADVCASLFGSTSILTLHLTDVWISLAVSVVVVVVFLLFFNRIFAVTFDSNFMQATGSKPAVYEILLAVVIGIVIALSMRLVGSLLTSALIIFPAVSAMRVFKTYKSVTICAVAIAVFCALAGIFAAILAGTPVGSTIVIANLMIFVLFYAIGMVTRRFL
jgi:zinc transport system permease protein